MGSVNSRKKVTQALDSVAARRLALLVFRSPLYSAFTIALIVFQLRVVTGMSNILSIAPR